MARGSGGRSPVHKHSWRQKGIAAAAALAILTPVVDGYVEENMPEGLIPYVKSLEQPQVRVSPESRAVPSPEPTAQARLPSSLESVLDAPARTIALSPDIGLKLADASVALDSDIVTAYARGTSPIGSQADFFTAVSYIESDGGVLHVPRAYLHRVSDGQSSESAPVDVPFGDHHVKMEDLEGVLAQANDARSLYGRFGDQVVRDIKELGWSASRDVTSVLDEEQLATALEYYGGESGMRRTAGLLATIPEDVGITDLTDPEQSALAGAIMDAYTVHRLASNDVPVDERVRMLIYTAGPNTVLGHLPENHHEMSDEAFTEFARSVSGDWAAWYVEAGQQTLTALRTYGFDHMRETADVFQAYRQQPGSSGLRNETLGALYVSELETSGHIDSFERFRASVPDIKDPNQAYETFVSLGAPDSMYAKDR